MLKQPYNPLQNERGMAVFEMIPVLVVIVLFVNFSLGFFGAIHTGILNSIASRNYAFSTFANRSDLIYFRNNPKYADKEIHFTNMQSRVHGVTAEDSAGDPSNPPWIASSRTIDFMNYERRAAEVEGNNAGTHSKLLENTQLQAEQRNITAKVNPIWVKTTYGICLTAKCAP